MINSTKILSRFSEYYDSLVFDLLGEYKISKKYFLSHKDEFDAKCVTSYNSSKERRTFYHNGKKLFTTFSNILYEGPVIKYVVEVTKHFDDGDVVEKKVYEEIGE